MQASGPLRQHQHSNNFGSIRCPVSEARSRWGYARSLAKAFRMRCKRVSISTTPATSGGSTSKPTGLPRSGHSRPSSGGRYGKLFITARSGHRTTAAAHTCPSTAIGSTTSVHRPAARTGQRLLRLAVNWDAGPQPVARLQVLIVAQPTFEARRTPRMANATTVAPLTSVASPRLDRLTSGMLAGSCWVKPVATRLV